MDLEDKYLTSTWPDWVPRKKGRKKTRLVRLFYGKGRMRIRTLGLIAGATCCICAVVSAQPPTYKLGAINMQEAIAGTKDGQKAAQQLDAKAQPKQKEFDQRQTELAQLQDQFNKGGSVLSEDKRNQLLRDIDQKKKALERDISDAKEELTAAQQDALQGLGQRMMALIEKYAKDNGYSLILDFSNPSTPVLYASSAIDLTQDIIGLYDKANPVGRSGVSAPDPEDRGLRAKPRQVSAIR
jgi:outer membrane protein